MKQRPIRLLLVAAATMLVATSCKKDMFDEELYEEAVDYKFMVDKVDPMHNWCLTQNSAITIKTKTEAIRSVKLLTENPYTTLYAEIAAESIVFGTGVTLAYTTSVNTTTLYVVAYDANGNDLGYIPVSFGTDTLELSLDMLSRPNAIKMPIHQTFTYLYESTFPVPDDFDFNDMVLRISKCYPEVGNMLMVDLTVTLDACGADNLYGAAIQLVGVKYSDIVKVEAVDGKIMDAGYPMKRVFTTDDILRRGRQGEAVINLFECAQWVMSRKENNVGDIEVIRYNTSNTVTKGKNETATPVTATYRITFKDAQVAHNLTFDRIDPFIMHQQSQGGIGTWEVHTFAHRLEGTLNAVNTAAYAKNHVSWALVIPKRDFRYPLEGIEICTYQDELEAYFGPYEEFGLWMQNCEKHRDWYLHLTRSQLVY